MEDKLPANATRCPYEDNWYCKLLETACHPGMKGCALSGQEVIDALIAYREKCLTDQESSDSD